MNYYVYHDSRSVETTPDENVTWNGPEGESITEKRAIELIRQGYKTFSNELRVRALGNPGPAKSYKNLSDLEQKKMLEYYQTHTIDETATIFRITDRTGLAQFLSRNAQKTTLGGARYKKDVDEFTKLKIELSDKLGKDGRGLIEKLLTLYKERLQPPSESD